MEDFVCACELRLSFVSLEISSQVAQERQLYFSDSLCCVVLCCFISLDFRFLSESENIFAGFAFF